jgi:effector-binding domain-containing protein
MNDSVRITQVESQPTAAVRRKAAGVSELPTVIPAACGEVWEFARSAGLKQPGRLLAIYLDDDWNIEVGVEVAEPFTGDGNVVCSSTPAGLAVTAVHWGPYDRLSEAHEAIHRWSKEHGHALARPCWEVYGHWDDDPAKLRTDVFYLLQPGG